ncbi:hypothetical protein FACS189498_2590 [Spirochaetia bacterium]|nr:hypothetical protein FACS189498_2590 [Spirochaetia bacterium]
MIKNNRINSNYIVHQCSLKNPFTGKFFGNIEVNSSIFVALPFTTRFLDDVHADIIHLGALLADDFSLEVIKFLSGRGKLSVDSQGFLRDVKENNVIAVDWKEKKKVLKYVYFLKANEYELRTLTEIDNIVDAANKICEWGVKELIITLGASGSVIYNGKEFHVIPAYKVNNAVDATGCGDTFMGGYLYKRLTGEGIDVAAHFGAAMASLKIQQPGPFSNAANDINTCLDTYPRVYPNIYM